MKKFVTSVLAALLVLFGVALAFDSNEEISITRALMEVEAEAGAAEREQAQEGAAQEDPADEAAAADAAATGAGGEFSTLMTLLESAGMFETLDSQGPYTLFAPTNAAFENLEEGQLETLRADQEMLERVLGLHVVEGAYTIEELQDAGTVQTINGETLNIHLEADGLEVNDASFSATDVDNLYANGVIHVVEEVILPQEATPAQAAPRGQEQTTGEEGAEPRDEADIDVDVDQPGDDAGQQNDAPESEGAGGAQ